MYRILLVLLICNFQLSAQYRCIPHTSSGGNPGNAPYGDWPPNNYNLNINYSATPVWSSIVHINFPFLFNGLPVSDFKVSSTGILTFDTLVTNPAPTLSNALLPDPQLPDNSICVNGIAALYYLNTNNHSELWRYYQITPAGNFQLWISFREYSDSIVINDYYTSTWAIVLEENTNNIYIVNQINEDGSDPLVTTGIQVNDSVAFMVPGSPLQGLAGNSAYNFDNIYYMFMPGNAMNTDLSLVKPLQYEYLDSGDAPFSLGVEFINLGLDTINSIELELISNGGTVFTETFNSLSVPCGEVDSVFFSTPWNPAAGSYNLEFKASAINGIADEDTTNNNIYQYISVAQSMPNRRVMFEEFKGLWCSSCGYFTARLDSVMATNTTKASILKYDDFLNVPWEFQDHTTRSTYYSVTGYPGTYGNGEVLDDNPLHFSGSPWQVTPQLIDSLYEFPGLFYIQPQLTFDGFDATITATITSVVNINPTSHCRIMVSLVTDTVRFSEPQGISNEDHFYNTNWKMFPDANGTYIGAPVAGQTDSVSFSINVLDTMVNINEMHVVVFVQDTITREIYQVAEAPAIQLCQPSLTTVFYDLCEGDSVYLYGSWYSSNVTFPTQFTSASGCDSVEISYVKVHVVSSIIFYNNLTNKIQYSSIHGNMADSLHFYWYNSLTNQTYPAPIVSISYPWPTPYSPPGTGLWAMIIVNHYNCTDTSNFVGFASPGDTLLMSTICDGDSVLVGWNYYSLPGLYVDSLITQNATDSIIITALTVTFLDTTLVLAGDTLIAHAGYASYVWIDCASGLAIPGADTNLLVVSGGSYSVQMTDTNNCIAITPCLTITGLTEQIDKNVITIYPNPATREVIFQIPENLESTFIISDTRGRKVISGNISSGTAVVNISNLLPGIYFVIFNDDELLVNKKLIVY